MKSAVTTALLLIFSYVLQTSFFSAFFSLFAKTTGISFIEGHTVNLALIMLVYLSLHRDLSGTLIWSIAFGIVSASFGLAWNGAQATGMFIVGFLCSTFRNQLLLKEPISISLFVGGMVLVEGLVHFNVGRILSSIRDPMGTHFGFLMTQIFVDALFAPVAFYFLGFFDRWMGVAQTRRRSLISDI